MTVTEDLTAAADAIASLRNAAAALQGRLGETVDVRRLADDAARAAADLELLTRATGAAAAPAAGETVYIPDGDYDPSLWADVEDEGLGTLGRSPGVTGTADGPGGRAAGRA